MVVRRWVAALLALPLLVSCADGEASSDPDKPTPSVTSTESETPTGPEEPELPSAARKPTEAGAIAFVKHYWAMVGYAQSSGDTVGLQDASQNCDACRGGVKAIRSVYTRGGEVRGRFPRVRSVQASVLPGGADDQQVIAPVLFEVAVPATVEFFGEGDGRNKRWPGGVTSGRFLMRWQSEDEHWLVMDWDVL